MSNTTFRQRFLGPVIALGIGAAAAAPFALSSHDAEGSGPPAPQAVPVSVATVKSENAIAWSEFSGRLEAVERVEVRSRVAGAVQEIHFREGALVTGFTVDPTDYHIFRIYDLRFLAH